MNLPCFVAAVFVLFFAPEVAIVLINCNEAEEVRVESWTFTVLPLMVKAPGRHMETGWEMLSWRKWQWQLLVSKEKAGNSWKFHNHVVFMLKTYAFFEEPKEWRLECTLKSEYLEWSNLPNGSFHWHQSTLLHSDITSCINTPRWIGNDLTPCSPAFFGCRERFPGSKQRLNKNPLCFINRHLLITISIRLRKL